MTIGTRTPGNDADAVVRGEPSATIGATEGKSIVLFSDGTGNSSGQGGAKTNVWRLFQALDRKHQSEETSFDPQYDNGVGTSSNKYLAAIGGAFGWGLKRNVLESPEFRLQKLAQKAMRSTASGSVAARSRSGSWSD